MRLSVRNQNGTEGQCEQNVVLFDVFFRGIFIRKLSCVGEIQLALRIDMAKLQFYRVKSLECAVVNRHTFRTEFVKIAVHRNHCVGLPCQFRAVFLNRRTEGVHGKLSSKLGRICQIDLGKIAAVA